MATSERFALGAAAIVACGCWGAVASVGAIDASPMDEGDAKPKDADTTPPITPSGKLDLLLVVDNSISMADKQNDLARSIPLLVKGLTSPDLDSAGKPTTKPIVDLHVAIITSSLGSHGTGVCDSVVTSNKHNNDRGHLLPRAGEWEKNGWAVGPDGVLTPTLCATPVASTALTWVVDPSKGPATFVGAKGSTAVQATTSCVVLSAREDGCGYEETLEAMYHFLIDPAPYEKAEVKCAMGAGGDSCGTNKIKVEGVDSDLLAQRAAFLRPDSVLVVVVLSDENDSSLRPADLNWLPWGFAQGGMPHGWTDCAKVPDDFEPTTGSEYDKLHAPLADGGYNCWSCFEKAGDPNCGKPWSSIRLNSDIDGRNTREFQHVQRFGFNFLWPKQRYVDAFSKGVVPASDGSMQPNPIFAGGKRAPGMVLLAGIVGVPKQLVSDATGAPKTLSESDWAKIVGPPGVRDPHMIESIAPRFGIAKFIGDRSIDPANGGDRDIIQGDDLQYACIGPRSTEERIRGVTDCEAADANLKNPLCGAGSTQPFFKAYPGLRHLRLIHDLGKSGYVASICQHNLAPAIQGIVTRLQPLIK